MESDNKGGIDNKKPLEVDLDSNLSPATLGM